MKTLFKGIYSGIKNSIKRFPLTIGISTACVILLIYISEITIHGGSNSVEKLSRVNMVLALGIPLSLCIKLFFERFENYKPIRLYSSYLGGAILLILYYYFLYKEVNMVSMTRYIAVSLIFYLVFLFISYLPKHENFELYIVKIFTRFFTTILYSLVLFLGLAAILFTIDELLGINIKGEFYYYTFLSVAGIFAPAYFLAGIPTKNEKLSLEDYSRLLKVLVLYIVMPLITVYTIILYIYFGKIIITRVWPQGLVSHLVLWYSVISAAVLFFITPLSNEKSWPRRYMRYFPKAILPLIVMMFISIGIRINAYGLTENRYYVVALGIWAFVVMIYFAFGTKLRNIILPLSLAIITFVSVFGPLSSYSISKYSQSKRINEIFVKNNMIKDNNVIKASAMVSQDDAKNITSILNYFERKHSLTDIKTLPKDFKTSDMEKVLGVKYTDEYFGNNNEFYYFSSAGLQEPIDIRGYDYFFDSRNYGQIASENSSFNIRFDYETTTLKITKVGKEIYSRDLQYFADKVIEKYGMNQNGASIPSKELNFEDENGSVKIKIQFNNISGNKNPSNGEMESKNFDFYVIVKVK